MLHHKPRFPWRFYFFINPHYPMYYMYIPFTSQETSSRTTALETFWLEALVTTVARDVSIRAIGSQIVQDFFIDEGADLGGHGSRQRVLVHTHTIEIRDTPNLSRHLSHQFVGLNSCADQSNLIMSRRRAIKFCFFDAHHFFAHTNSQRCIPSNSHCCGPTHHP
jgi:hypothetical protein